MMTNETTSSALAALAPDAPSYSENPEILYLLLEERIRRYTMGDSSSIPVDTARRLLESILYCLDVQIRAGKNALPDTAPMKARWQSGVDASKRIAKRARLLLLQAQRTPPPLTNTGYCDTLSALPAFFSNYDPDFFAQEIPCSFDYPLCQPVSEEVLGAEYMQDYLRRLLAESAFLRVFSAETLRALYENYYIDYVDLLVNLYLPAAEMATLCALAGAPVRGLILTPEQLLSLNQRLLNASDAEAQAIIDEAAACALFELQLSGDLLEWYTKQTARDLLVRLRAGKS
jgi:hypothetical protein